MRKSAMLRHRGVGRVSAFRVTAMLSINASDKTVSDELYSTTKLDGLAAVVEREPAARSACPECEG